MKGNKDDKFNNEDINTINSYKYSFKNFMINILYNEDENGNYEPNLIHSILGLIMMTIITIIVAYILGEYVLDLSR